MIGLMARLYLFVLTAPVRHARDLSSVAWPIWIAFVAISIIAIAIAIGVGLAVDSAVRLIVGAP